jgi:hypothetical protein
MSLINDALRRTQKAQENQPLSPGPELKLHPAPRTNPPPLNTKLLLGALTFLLLVLGFALVGMLLPGKMDQPVQAKTAAADPAVPPAPPRMIFPPRKAEPPAPAPILAAAPVALVDPAPAAAIEPTNPPIPQVATAPAPPAPFRLQAILFNPSRPSAIINGSTVFLGGQLGEFRVTQIGTNTVILAGSTRTNVLTIE